MINLRLCRCEKCHNTEYEIKSVWLATKDVNVSIKNLLPRSELFYIKICKNCGHTEIYCAKLVSNEFEKDKL